MKIFPAAALVILLLIGCGDDSASCWAQRAAITAENDLKWQQYEYAYNKWEPVKRYNPEPKRPRLAELPNCE